MRKKTKWLELLYPDDTFETFNQKHCDWMWTLKFKDSQCVTFISCSFGWEEVEKEVLQFELENKMDAYKKVEFKG